MPRDDEILYDTGDLTLEGMARLSEADQSAAIARVLRGIDNARGSFGGYNPNHTDREPPPTWEPRLPRMMHGRYVEDLELPEP